LTCGYTSTPTTVTAWSTRKIFSMPVVVGVRAGVGVGVGHGVGGEDHVIAVLAGGAGGGLDADAVLVGAGAGRGAQGAERLLVQRVGEPVIARVTGGCDGRPARQGQAARDARVLVADRGAEYAEYADHSA
jgi:hypothetical protein